MPGVKDTSAIPGMICAPPETPEDAARNIPQPRPPRSFQGLLHFAMAARGSEDAPTRPDLGPLDEERKNFLDNAMRSMTIDVIEVLQVQIKILQDADKISETSDITEYLMAFDTILQYVDDIDVANDFHKIGGFIVFDPCLKCVQPQIRAGAYNLLAELCQNNPYCENIAIESGFIHTILTTLDTDPDEEVRTKSVYAMSCMLRSYGQSYIELFQDEGLMILLRSMQKKEDRLRGKIAFMLRHLCSSLRDTTFKVHLINLGFTPVLVNIISEERIPSHEHVLAFMLILSQNNEAARIEYMKPEYGLKNLLLNHLYMCRAVKDLEAEERHCLRMLRNIFNVPGL